MIYPWWQTGFYFYDNAGPAPGQRFYFRKRQRSADAYYAGNDQLFVNTQPWPVYIDELRFFQRYGNVASTRYYSTFDGFGVRMQSSLDGNVVNNFMPISSLHYCDPVRCEPCITRRGGKMTLPSPFYLDGSENFSFRVFPGSAGIASIAGIQIGLLGFDPKNSAPVVRTAVPITVTAAQAPTDYVLDAGRDKNVRDISVNEIAFSISGGAAEVGAFWEVELEISPPRGPKWTDDVSTHLGFLVDQLPPFGYNKGAVVMTPPTPWAVNPGGNFMVEGLTLPTSAQIPIQFAAAGWIACMAFGHQEVPDDYHR
jgi:hypothetical protein